MGTRSRRQAFGRVSRFCQCVVAAGFEVAYEQVEVPAILAASAEEGSPMPTERPPEHPPEPVGATAEPLSLYGQEQRVPIDLG
jgi:hypothetical protein